MSDRPCDALNNNESVVQRDSIPLLWPLAICEQSKGLVERVEYGRSTSICPLTKQY